uniref:U19-Austrotoxin-Ht1b_1 n=1 Tax=Hickmania troglodytes TaxID=489260 RepID=A0A482ZC32_9ARAC
MKFSTCLLAFFTLVVICQSLPDEGVDSLIAEEEAALASPQVRMMVTELMKAYFNTLSPADREAAIARCPVYICPPDGFPQHFSPHLKGNGLIIT